LRNMLKKYGEKKRDSSLRMRCIQNDNKM
jgi:hypothetical protein